jgi:acetyltransferase-like isoleucine patch superfamily enzyme
MKTHKKSLKKFIFSPWTLPALAADRFTKPIPVGVWLINIFFQRILGINSCTPWMVHFTSRVTGRVEIGKQVEKSFAVSGSCYIQGYNGIYIGDNTIFGPSVKIISSNHDPKDLSRNIKTSPIIIGKNCWIGTNAVILPGVKLGDNVIVGAGSVVTKSFPANSTIVGVPAKQILNSDES